jgi:hypothetical protein
LQRPELEFLDLAIGLLAQSIDKTDVAPPLRQGDHLPAVCDLSLGFDQIVRSWRALAIASWTNASLPFRYAAMSSLNAATAPTCRPIEEADTLGRHTRARR